MDREHETSARPWGTLEELLLASAVNRHGTRCWDSIAAELQNRRSPALPSLTPQLCKDKFQELKRRFISQNDNVDFTSSFLVDQLRRIRVEELRREVQRHDESIVSLELKVKRLEEERARSLREEADLKPSPEIIAGRPAPDDDSGERDDRSFNESNSTSQKPESTAVVKNEENDAVLEAEGGGREEKAKVKEVLKPDVKKEKDPVRAGGEPPGELGYENEDDNKKQSSDVQSSASLSKKKLRGEKVGGSAATSSSGEEPEGDAVSPTNRRRASAAKSEPFARLLGIVRSHRLGSAFERRQRSQESERYRGLIRQHIDLQTIQCRLEKGAYNNSTHKFFRDLLLLFTNFIIFYRRTSHEHVAAQELRRLVLKEINNKLPKPQPRPQPETTKPAERLRKQLSIFKSSKSSTMAASGRRSSIRAASGIGQKGEENGTEVEEKPKPNEKIADDEPFVGIEDKGIRKKRSRERSSGGRRNSRANDNNARETKHEYGGNELSSHDGLEIKVDKKKESVGKKKQGAVSFLRRMKQSSPSEAIENKEDDREENDSEEESKDSRREEDKKRGKSNGRKTEARCERITRSSGGRGAREESRRARRNVGRPSRRGMEEPTGKRRKDSGENEAAVGSGGRARKRARR